MDMIAMLAGLGATDDVEKRVLAEQAQAEQLRKFQVDSELATQENFKTFLKYAFVFGLGFVARGVYDHFENR